MVVALFVLWVQPSDSSGLERTAALLTVLLSAAAAHNAFTLRGEVYPGITMKFRPTQKSGRWMMVFDIVPMRETNMDLADHIVFIVDDDKRICEALHDLLASLGLRAVTFGSAAEYREFPKTDLPACLILDIELPDANGLELQKQLSSEHHPPIVFITGHGNVPASVQAIKAGAVDFLSKPFSQQQLMEAVRCAIERDQSARAYDAKVARLNCRLAGLTPRERQVLPLVVSGRLNKQAAADLGISETTLQIHRGRIMHKMKADSLADLVRMAGTLGIPVSDG